MSSFDEHQSQVLRPIADCGVTLHYPLFANTFPLAFHYAKALEKWKPKKSGRKPRISLWPWDSGPPKPIKTSGVRLFYATQQQLSRASENITAVHVTLYRPTSFFIDRTATAAYELRRNEHKDGLWLNPDTVGNLFGDTSRIEIVSDTPEQAGYLQKQLLKHSRHRLDFEIARDNQSEERILRKRLSDEMRIYFFGAPGTARLLSQRDRFIPVRLDNQTFTRESLDVEDLNLFDTFCCIACTDECNDQLESIRIAVDTYHKQLYETAESEPWAFEDIFLRYNERAWRSHSVAVFDTAKDFARSISDHHLPERSVPSSRRPTFPGSILPIIGHSTPKRAYRHVHFGAGKIGLGLVAPVFDSVSALAILQRHPSPSWREFDNSGKISGAGEIVDIFVNSPGKKPHKIKVTVIRPITSDNQINPDFARVVQEWRNNKINILILASFEDHGDLLKPVIESATSLSVALGGDPHEGVPHEIMRLIQAAQFDNKPPLFPFENVVQDNLKSLTNVELVATVIDRICSKVDVEGGGRTHTTPEPYKISVAAEEYASVIFGQTTSDLPKILAKNKSWQVLADQTDGQIAFYKNRKRWLFNQFHFMLAVFAYQYLKAHAIPIENLENQMLNVIIEGMLAEPDTSLFIKTTNDLQILRLLLTTDAAELNGIFDTQEKYQYVLELRDYIAGALRRIRMHPDEVRRVFGQEKLKKQPDRPEEHMRDVEDFLLMHERQIKEFGITDCPRIKDFKYSLKILQQRYDDFLETFIKGGVASR